MVDNERSGESGAGKQRAESVDVLEFVGVRVSGGDGIRGSCAESVVVGNVGSETTDSVRLVAVVDLGEKRCGS